MGARMGCARCPLHIPALREINATPELTSSLAAPSSAQLIFIKLNICAVLCKGRNISQNAREAPRRAAQPPPCRGAPLSQRGRESSEAEF